jgi:membrane-associated phospholipid phosphatase
MLTRNICLGKHCMSEIQKYRALNLPMVLSILIALIFLNLNQSMHAAVTNWDVQVAIVSNSIMGHNPRFDQSLGWLNSRAADAVILSLMAALFVIHSLKALTFQELIDRLSFWWWVATICIATYIVICATEHLYCRPIPCEALPQLSDVRVLYGIPVHASALNSYPSGHGLAYTFFALMALYRRFYRMSFLIMSFGTIMLSTRMILGMHWFSDIFFGSLPLSLVLSSLAFVKPFSSSYFPLNQFTRLALTSVARDIWPLSTDTRKQFDRDQMKVLVESECLRDVSIKDEHQTGGIAAREILVGKLR